MGKGLVDVMSNFGVKSITRRYVFALGKGFTGCKEIGDYLDFCGDEKMISWHIDTSIFKEWRSIEGEIKLMVAFQVIYLFTSWIRVKLCWERESICVAAKSVSIPNFPYV